MCAFIRKPMLKKLLTINDMMKKDIGKETTQDYPQNHLDSEIDNDITTDEVYNKSNEIVNQYSCGNIGEFFGDMSNDNHYANFLFIRNPLDNKHISTYEDFGTMYQFGDWWTLRKPEKVQKFDQPDKELFEGIHFNSQESRIKKFKDFLK